MNISRLVKYLSLRTLNSSEYNERIIIIVACSVILFSNNLFVIHRLNCLKNDNLLLQ